MKQKIGRKKYIPLVFIGGAIPTIIILGNYFAWSQAIVVPLVVVLTLALGAMALWTFANRQANHTKWWQDDSASGWRGY